MTLPPRGLPPSQPGAPTRHDHQQMNFWLWACIRNGEIFLNLMARAQSSHPAPPSPVPFETWETTFAAWQQAITVAWNETELSKYHFLAAVGQASRILKQAQHQFPSIHPPYSRAFHFIKEGSKLRGLYEHTNEHYRGEGKHNADDFVRTVGLPETSLPGSGASIDATSVLVTDEGHWLGGRLLVERVLAELRPIAAAAALIPPPEASYPPHAAPP